MDVHIELCSCSIKGFILFAFYCRCMRDQYEGLLQYQRLKEWVSLDGFFFSILIKKKYIEIQNNSLNSTALLIARIKLE